MSSVNIVVAGGGGAGLISALKLSDLATKFPRNKNLNITLIDNKNFVEYTPSLITSLFMDTNQKFDDYFNKITVPYKKAFGKSKINFVLGNVDYIAENNVHLSRNTGSIKYDYLLYCLGSSYNMPFKHDSNTVNQEQRKEELKEFRHKVKYAKNILVVGGGPVGTEFASNLIGHPDSQKVTLVHSKPELNKPYSEMEGHHHDEENHHHGETEGHTHGSASVHSSGEGHHSHHKRSLDINGIQNIVRRHAENPLLSKYGLNYPHSHTKLSLYDNHTQISVKVVLNNRANYIGKTPYSCNLHYKLQKAPFFDLYPDLVVSSVGLKPNTMPLKKYFSNSLDKKGFVKVNQNNFKIQGSNNIFALGDTNNITDYKRYDLAVSQASACVDYIISNLSRRRN